MLKGKTATFTGTYQNAQGVYLLLNTANTYSLLAGSVVGTAPVWSTTAQASMGGGNAVLDMLTIPVATAGKTLTTVTVTDTNGWGALQMDLAGLTADFTPPAPPVVTPPTGTGNETGNHNGDHKNTDKTTKAEKDDNNAADKAEKADRAADKN